MNSLALQAGALRHFLPIVEKKDPQGTVVESYRAALETLEYLAAKQTLLRELRVLEMDKPELKIITDGDL